jgi:hypothetical protein
LSWAGYPAHFVIMASRVHDWHCWPGWTGLHTHWSKGRMGWCAAFCAHEQHAFFPTPLVGHSMGVPHAFSAARVWQTSTWAMDCRRTRVGQKVHDLVRCWGSTCRLPLHKCFTHRAFQVGTATGGGAAKGGKIGGDVDDDDDDWGKPGSGGGKRGKGKGGGKV